MLTYNEIRDIIESLPMAVDKDDRETTELIKKVGKRLGYTIPDCRCHDKFSDLSVKLKIWLRNHPEECHYQMRPGIVRRGPDGTNIYNLNLTDESAEWLLENDPEGAKYITKIVSDESEETSNTINQNETESVSENVSAETVVVEPEPESETFEVEPAVVEEPKKKSTRRKK